MLFEGIEEPVTRLAEFTFSASLLVTVHAGHRDGVLGVVAIEDSGGAIVAGEQFSDFVLGRLARQGADEFGKRRRMGEL